MGLGIVIEVVLLLLLLVAGYLPYRARWPDGFLPADPPPDYDTLRRTGRRRVLPLPPRREEL